jgi:hypothetical protein
MSSKLKVAVHAAKDYAENSPPNNGRRTTTHLHYAAILGPRNKVLATATNVPMTRSKTPCSGGYTIHAERNAIHKLGDYTKLRGATMLVVRILSDGSFGESKPCKTCMPHLKKCMELYGMKVFYSTGGFKEL